MPKYLITEITSTSNVTLINSKKQLLHEVLKDFYQDKYTYLFDNNNSIKGHFSLFVNKEQFANISGIHLRENDEIHIISSLAGG